MAFAEIVFSAGASIDTLDGSDYTLLMRALEVPDLDMAEWLLSGGFGRRQSVKRSNASLSDSGDAQAL